MRAALLVLWVAMLMLLVTAARPVGLHRASPAQSEPSGSIRLSGTESAPNPSPTPTCDECSIFATSSAAMATTFAGQLDAARPRVARAVMFWREGCPHCHEVIDNVLPALRDQYGKQLEVLLIEVLTDDDVQLLLAAAAAHEIPEESLGVPFLFIGDRALVGSWAISSELPGLIDRFLAEGGVDYPEIPGLAARLPSPLPPTPAEASPAAPAQPAGFELAVAVLIGMAIGLAYALLRWVRNLRRPSLTAPNAGWHRWGIILLASLGKLAAGYLGDVETFDAAPVCGPVGDCQAVQYSPYAKLLGVIPVSFLGLIGFVAILAVAVWGLAGPAHRQLQAGRMVFYLSFAGVVFSLYLTYLEPFVIGTVCAWCLSSAVSITGVMLLSLPQAAGSAGAAARGRRARGNGRIWR